MWSDRANKMVLSAAGGTWAMKNGKYEETCDFSTENFAETRGKTFPYTFKIDGDRWTLNSGPALENQNNEVWTRVK